MPGFDGTGFRGMGPMTGGGRGLCHPQNARTAYHGFGFRSASHERPYIGRGRGGLPRCRYPGALGRWASEVMPPAVSFQPSPGDELDFLKEQSKAMKRDMEEIERRIRDLEKQDQHTGRD